MIDDSDETVALLYLDVMFDVVRIPMQWSTGGSVKVQPFRAEGVP